MQKILFIPLVILTLISCRLQVITTDINKSRSINTKTDSIIFLNLSDTNKLVNSKFLISTTRIKSPFGGFRNSYDSLMQIERNIAKRKGANVIQITRYNSNLSRFLLETKMFYLEEPYLELYKMKSDSINKVHDSLIKNVSTVHIKDYEETPKRHLFFNDSLIGQIKGVGFDGVRNAEIKNFVFNKEGSFGINGFEPLNIKIGKEYYIVLYTTLVSPALFVSPTVVHNYKLVDKEHFDSKWRFFNN